MRYDSRAVRYKLPFGAVPAGTRVRVRVEDARGAVTLVWYRDYEPWNRLALSPAGEGAFEGEFAPDVPQVYWYFFECGDGRRYYRDTATNEPVEAADGATWQLTVYDPAFRTPEARLGGVMYQIFPDRFARSGEPKHGVPDDRRVHADATEPPDPAEPPGRPPCSDYYGGDFAGIEANLDRLETLSVDAVYLNPIFEAHSNHRYNTADYTRVDPMLGTREDFARLLAAARARGIGVVLDGVFSHTGDDSVYYNRAGRYPTAGAWQSPESPYRRWYTFREDGSCRCWWNVPSLPEVDENEPGYAAFIERVVRGWQSMGTAGWRLDVADELPDAFLRRLRRAVKEADPEAVLIGEVWEDATTKQKEGVRREYLLGGQLDTVMNYPLRTAILGWARDGDGAGLRETALSLAENYPPMALNIAMNILGTHDTKRLATELGGTGRQIMAVALQYTLPGVPCVYYGDENSMEGGDDPMCRAFYDERGRVPEVYEAYKALGTIRRRLSCWREGSLTFARADADAVVLKREDGNCAAVTVVNRGETLCPLPAGDVLWSHNQRGGALFRNGAAIVRVK